MHCSINDHASILMAIRKKLWAQKRSIRAKEIARNFPPKKIKKKGTKNTFFWFSLIYSYATQSVVLVPFRELYSKKHNTNDCYVMPYSFVFREAGHNLKVHKINFFANTK